MSTKKSRRQEPAHPAERKPSRAALLVGQLTGRRGPAPGLLHDRRGPSERRGHSIWSFFYGGLRPRRRVGRRGGDLHRTFLDWHEPGVLYLALAILLMSCADALFTLNLLAAGGNEINHLMRALLGRGPEWFLSAKIGMTALSILVLVTAARRLVLGRLPVMWLIWLFFAGYVVLIAWEVYLLGWHATAMGDEALKAFSRWVAD